jgi:dipeptidyl aminopeptidase/acylaminoacyl peptidase
MHFLRSARLFFAIASALPLWSAKQPIVETDLLKMQRVTEVRVTPDGAFAVYGVQSIHTGSPASPGGDPTYEYRVHLWISDLRDPAAKPVQITFGDRSDSMLAVSPDGRELAFVRADHETETERKPLPQVWIIPLHGPGEARMVTHLEHGATAPKWRHDGRALLVSSAVPISKIPGKPPFDLERPGREWWDFDRPPLKDAADAQAKTDKKLKGSPDGDLRSIRDWLEHNSGHNDPADITRMNFLGELSLAGEMTIRELYRVDLGSEPKTTQLTNNYHDHNDAIFAPQDDRILFASEPESNLHPDRIRNKSIVWQMNADGSDERPLLSQEGYALGDPQFTPDGKHLILVGQQNDQPTYRQAMLAICDLDGSHLTWLTKDGDPSVQRPEITSDGRVYYTLNYNGGEPLRSVDLKTRKVQDVIAGPLGVNAFGVGNGRIVYAQISVENPNELYLTSSTERSRARRLTELNAVWLEGKVLSLPQEHWVTRPDGTRVQYWVMNPTNAEKGKKYPWVLDMHGGPSAMWGPGEFTMWHEFQIFCSFGYGVVYSNPRGSSGYGYGFQRANYKDWGDGPMGDIMAALDDAKANDPMIDESRLFVTGGSYAGYMTAWIVGHTNRFKAAAALRGVYDLSTFFGEGNAYRLVPEQFGGYPWDLETRRILDQQSPISYVANIQTPLLIIHGSSDNRTGIVQGQMLFRALKQLNRPVEYIRYPGAGHEITRSGAPNQRMDHMLRIVEFFERYSHNERTAPGAAAGAPTSSN